MQDFGTMNAHVVGTLMKEAVRRAIVAIRAERFTFEVQVKGQRPASGEGDPSRRASPDMVTSADHAAQKVYVKLLREWFPSFGIVAEEDHLRVPCTATGCNAWFSVDPLDGTRAFIRRQSHGVGTMISLVVDDVVLAACVGDVMTQEVYALRPGGDRVHRISEFGIAETLGIDENRPLSSQRMLLRTDPRRYSPALRQLLAPRGGLMPGYETTTGSVGIGMARVWKGEIGGAVIRPVRGTPWDMLPLIGLSRALDFAFIQIDDDGELREVTLPVRPDVIPIDRETWLVHRSRLPELHDWWTIRGRTAAEPG
ncbi:MAG: hypothetical protein D6798_21035 [Deltaproteobacteria bacterium]|nr:MAG: hypothetical protein D6798_21035 [Deltaproteobacteria bacterium]